VQLFGTKGQKFPSCPGTKGQRDKLKFFPWDRTGRDIERLSRDVPGRDSGTIIYISFTIEVPIFRKKSDFFVVASCFLNLKQEKDVLKQEKDVLKQEKDLLKQEMDILKQKRMF
jgi:hypothetical protein